MEAKQRLLEERDRLLAVRADAQGDLGDDERGATGELSTVDQHPAELGTETFEREVEQSVSESVQAELAEVDAALARLDEGTYGRCERCGRPIGAERLDALPATRWCLEHAQEQEAAAAGLTPLPDQARTDPSRD